MVEGLKDIVQVLSGLALDTNGNVWHWETGLAPFKIELPLMVQKIFSDEKNGIFLDSNDMLWIFDLNQPSIVTQLRSDFQIHDIVVTNSAALIIDRCGKVFQVPFDDQVEVIKLDFKVQTLRYHSLIMVYLNKDITLKAKAPDGKSQKIQSRIRFISNLMTVGPNLVFYSLSWDKMLRYYVYSKENKKWSSDEIEFDFLDSKLQYIENIVMTEDFVYSQTKKKIWIHRVYSENGFCHRFYTFSKLKLS